MDDNIYIFDKIISYTCDLHLQINIFNPLLNGLKNEYFVLQPYPSKFQDFKKFVWFGFSSSSPNEHVFSWNGTSFCCTESLKSIVWLYAFLLITF
jgi:hypothetical protein